MSMYNMLFGSNPLSDAILGMLGLTRSDVGRFRNVFVSEGEVAVYTRLGGGNRECCCDSQEEHEQGGCYQKCIERLQGHLSYLRDRDDDFDCTYATFYFSFPKEYAEVLAKLEMGKVDSDEMWAKKLDEVRTMSKEQLESKYPDVVALVNQIAQWANSEEGV